jgi:hypothetical protein
VAGCAVGVCAARAAVAGRRGGFALSGGASFGAVHRCGFCGGCFAFGWFCLLFGHSVASFARGATIAPRIHYFYYIDFVAKDAKENPAAVNATGFST